MKKFTIVTQYIATDMASPNQVRKDIIVSACRTFLERGYEHLKLDSLGAEIFGHNGEVAVVVGGIRYVCKAQGEGEIFCSDLDGANSQKFDDSGAAYEQIKILEEVMLLAANNS
jgi:hypothetical protein